MAVAPKTIVSYPLAAGRLTFDVTFDYLVRRFIKVTLVGPEGELELKPGSDYRFTTPRQIETARNWTTADGYTIMTIRRYTDAKDRLVDFSDGSILTAYDLNVAQIQSLHIAEEGRDAIDERLGLDPTGQLDAHDKRIVNVADGINPNDAVNVKQLKGAEAAVAISARQASESATRAEGAAKAAAAVSGAILSPRLPPYNAAGNGLADDTAPFAAFERDYSGRTVDLGGGRFRISQIPTGNIYINGEWVVSGGDARPAGFTRPAFEGDTIMNRGPIYHPYGGALNRLRADLMNPLVQEMGIVWIGDSITWGSGSGENAPTEPRNGTLKDPRDHFGTNTYVNHMRRYLIEEYLSGSTVTTEKWPLSPSGDAIVHAVKRIHLMPYGQDFGANTRGSPISVNMLDADSMPTKRRILITNQTADQTGEMYGEITFKFTGRKFTMFLGLVNGSESDYVILVNGVQYGGRHSCHAGSPTDDGGGMVSGDHRERTHTIPYVRNGVVTIRALRPVGHPEGTSSVFRLGSLIIDRHLRLTNNGINGSAFRQYRVYNMPPTGTSYSGSVAINEGDLYCYIQLGTNDRGFRLGPQSIHGIMDEIRAFLDVVPQYCTPIMTVANPAKEFGSGSNLTMEDIRCAITTVCRERVIDVVDNYAAFRGVKIRSFANDDLHPNPWGFAIMASNAIKALEQSIDTGVKPPVPPVPVRWFAPTDPRLVLSGNYQVIDRPAPTAAVGAQRLLRDNGALSGAITFKVSNADRFCLAFSSLPTQCMAYDLVIDGVDAGRFLTAYLVEGGGTSIYASKRWHTFTQGEHTIQIKPYYSPLEAGMTQVFYFEGVGLLEGADFA